MSNRRKFLIQSSLVTGAIAFLKPFQSVAAISNHPLLDNKFQLNRVPFFHTSKLHGSLAEFTIGKKTGLGGLQNINGVLKQKGGSPILLDAGNFLHSNTGLLEDKNMVAMMNKTGYHAANLGSSEISKGQEYLALLLQGMDFKLINCNYNFSDPALKNKISQYHIIKYGQYKIGVTGVCRKLKNITGINCYHPYKKANQTAAYLKQQLNCDLVICLSDLNFNEKNNQPNNYMLAGTSENIDVIIGNLNDAIHTQFVIRNKVKNEVIISNSGSNGLTIGNLNFTFKEGRTKHLLDCKNYIPGSSDNNSFPTDYSKLIA